MNMSRIKTGMLTTLLVGLGVLGLAGCGGDSATATPVVAPTATTGAAVEPTATTAAMEEPTATTAAMDEPTATTGTSGTGTGDSAAMDLLTKASTAMKAVKTYHISMTVDSGAGTSTIEGDLMLPDSYRMTIETAGASSEVIIVGGSSYVKVPGSDQYFESPADPSLLDAANATSFADVAQNATVVGDEDIDGAATTHITFSYDANKVAESTGAATDQDLGTAQSDIWVDKSTNLIRQVKIVSEAAGASSTTTVKYSKFDETIDPPIEKPTNIMSIPTVAVP